VVAIYPQYGGERHSHTQQQQQEIKTGTENKLPGAASESILTCLTFLNK
jgi:hypothetical protein